MTIRAKLLYTLLLATSVAVHATSIAARRDDYDGEGYPGDYNQRGRGNAGDYFNDYGTNHNTEPENLTAKDLRKFQTINWNKAVNIRYAHAVLASLAFIFFFPFGAIIIRILPGRAGLYLHGLMQLFAYFVYTAAVGMGIWLATYIKFSDYNLLTNYHPLIGLVVFSLLFFQPISGIIHHLGFKRHGRRTFVSHTHMALGKILITLGMINGGLGLYLADNATRGRQIAYGVISGIIWLFWMIISVINEVRRRRKLRAVAAGTAITDKDGAVVTNGNGVANGNGVVSGNGVAHENGAAYGSGTAATGNTTVPTHTTATPTTAGTTTAEKSVPATKGEKIGPEYA